MRALVLVAGLLLLLASGSALARDPPAKLAIVIANADYDGTDWNKLKNPVNDARLLSQALAGAGFKVLTPAVNLRRDRLLARLDQFRAEADKLPENSIAWIYYSGHGVQVDGENYLIPLGAPSPVRLAGIPASDRETALQREYVAVDTLLRQFGSARAGMSRVANVLILDACRTNPLDQRSRSGGGAKGLADVPNMANSLIAFAASPGTIADDGSGGNSPYALALAQQLSQRAVPLELLFNGVTSRVLEITNGAQRPDYRVGLAGFFCLEGCGADAASFTSGRRAAEPAPAGPRKADECPFCPELVRIGGPERPLVVSRTQVTIGQWQACVRELACPAAGEEGENERLPVTSVSWSAAAQYVAWLSSRSGKDFRLPTSAEWDILLARHGPVARAVSRKLRPADAGPRSESGLVNFGQLMEWTSSCAGAAEPCRARVARGAAADDPTGDVAAMHSFGESARGSSLGFRVVEVE